MDIWNIILSDYFYMVCFVISFIAFISFFISIFLLIGDIKDKKPNIFKSFSNNFYLILPDFMNINFVGLLQYCYRIRKKDKISA